ncbi:MAG TPA: SDR family NAD(P)-dependent oxidoreductase [Polyangia bacterium]|jgi:NAD(P)-dependent dehydrogenase (short-subunit alcohol dehydrogenase family)|nr:SDR family NAD(P)-dependent oxidoreductase [Polyangia bacterium]
MASDFAGRHVVVTGGTGALGHALVQAFLDAGAVCHVPHRGAAPAELPTSESLRLVGGVELADEARVMRFYADLPDLWASVHAAGGFAAAPATETPLAALRAQFDQNLVSAFLCSREAARHFGQRGAPGGRIVNVASRAAIEPAGGSLAYTISKAGVAALTRALAVEMKAAGVLVNAVVPSIIDTPANRKAMPGPPEVVARWSKPADVAATILWLASPENRLTTGALVPV